MLVLNVSVMFSKDLRHHRLTFLPYRLPVDILQRHPMSCLLGKVLRGLLLISYPPRGRGVFKTLIHFHRVLHAKRC